MSFSNIFSFQNILRGNLLQLLLRHVDDATAKNLQDPANHWPHLECVLYCWSAVAESLAEEVSSIVLFFWKNLRHQKDIMKLTDL